MWPSYNKSPPWNAWLISASSREAGESVFALEQHRLVQGGGELQPVVF